MTNRLKALAIAGLTATGLLMGCGDATGSDTLEPAEVSAIADALVGAINVSNSSYSRSASFSNVPASPPISYLVAINIPMKGTSECPIAGHITMSGNVNVDTATQRIQGLVTFQVGDRTNNLNDCEVVAGLIVDGTLTLTMSGSATAGITLGLAGTLSVNRRGQSGGLHPLSSCFIAIHVAANADYATGSACGQPI